METPRSQGITTSERYLAQLADRTFLNLWAWPNLYRNETVSGKTTAKELCDLLVVCGDHVIIFSDKTVKWSDSKPVEVAWPRWYRRAVENSVRQILGAEKWITDNPGRIYVDVACTKPLPIALPPPDKIKIHAVAVALGAAKACSEFFKGDVGSFLVRPHTKDGAHTDSSDPEFMPFAIGDVNAGGTFVHVMNDVTLDILLKELDTVTDFTDYLSRKEEFVRSGHLLTAGGEEDLLAYYLKNLIDPEHHGFPGPKGEPWQPKEHLGLDTGGYSALIENPQYKRKKLADRDSYIWDSLIRAFTDHMLAGTTMVTEGETFNLKDHEKGVRFMAQEPRLKRRMLGSAILEVLKKSHLQTKTFKAMLPPKDGAEGSTAYAFLTLGHPKTELKGGYEQYRRVRSNFLITYCMEMLRRHPHVKRILGIATESAPREGDPSGSSEDMVLAEQPVWTPQLIADLEADCEDFGVMREGAYTESHGGVTEYPEEQTPQLKPSVNQLNRHQRRAQAGKQKRKGHF